MLARISNLLANDREGYRKHVADDTETSGYSHTATVGPKRASELVDQHHLPEEFKHYLARELDEALLNLLQWEGYPITDDELDEDDRDGGDPPGGYGPFVEDEYFEANTSRRQRRLLDDPTPELQSKQESLIARHVVDGFEDSDEDLLATLVADGGEVSPDDIADEHGWHIETVYRAVQRLEDLVEHHYGELSLRSHHIAQQVYEHVQAAQASATDAMETLARSLEREVGLELSNDALVE